MEEKKYYTTGSSSYTDQHNNYFDMLLWSWVQRNIDYNYNWLPLIDYDSEKEAYYGRNKEGQKMLEHLMNIDVIAIIGE